jgi:valyl-tRNA synthetase
VVARFPEAVQIPRFLPEAEAWGQIQDLISGVRSVRSQAGLPPRTEVRVFVRADQAMVGHLLAYKADICRLAFITDFEASETMPRPGQSLVTIGKGYEAYIPAAGLLDVAKERERLAAEMSRIEKIVKGLVAKLENPNFADRAPADVVAQTRAQHENLTSQLAGLKVSHQALS